MPELGYWGDVVVILFASVIMLGFLAGLLAAIWKDMNDGGR